MFREFPSCFWGGALLSLALFISEGYVLWKHFMGEHFLVSVDGGNFAPGEVVEVDYAYPGRGRFDELKVSLSYVINSPTPTTARSPTKSSPLCVSARQTNALVRLVDAPPD